MKILIMIEMVNPLNHDGRARDTETAAGALWVALIFAGTIGAARALAAEHENGGLLALRLSPADPTAIYAAKLAAGFIFMLIAEAAAILLLTLFFNLDFDRRIAMLAIPLALGALGFAALTTLLAGISDRVRARDLLFPLLAIPLFSPLMCYF